MHVVAPDMHHVEDVGQRNDDRRDQHHHAEAVVPPPPAEGRKEHEGGCEQKRQPQRVGGGEVPQVGESLGPPGGRPGLGQPGVGNQECVVPHAKELERDREEQRGGERSAVANDAALRP